MSLFQYGPLSYKSTHYENCLAKNDNCFILKSEKSKKVF